MAERAHHHHHHHHGHAGGALKAAAALTIAFAVVEALGGWWTGSLALLSDAGHALGSIAALVSGGIVALTGWTRADPIASLLICVLIAVSSVRLLRESLHALMEGVPHGLSVESIGTEMASVGGVLSVHDLHVWTLSGSRTALSAHAVVQTMAHWDGTRGELQVRLHDKFGIDHVTLQPESGVQPLMRH